MEREILFLERKPRLAFRERRDHDSGVAIRAISGKRGSGSAVERARSITIEDIWQALQGVRAKLEAAEERIDQLEKENQKLRKERWETEEFLQNKIKKLEKDVKDRDKKLAKANKQLAWFRKRFF